MITAQNPIDLHMHSTVSDGTDTPDQLLEQVRQAGLSVFSLTDHDAISGSLLMTQLLRQGDPFFIPGVEFSCKDRLGRYHILGYGYHPQTSGIRETVAHGHQLRMEKFEARLAFLQEKLGFHFPEEELARLRALDNPGKPHVGNLMVKLGYAKTKEQAIAEYINRAKTSGPSYLRPEEAISGILASGGIPILAHPCYGSGDQLILGDELEQRIRRMMDFGLRGVEAYYSGFSAKLRSEVLELADRFDLLVTAGSDYHGTNKLVQLGDTGLISGNSPAPGLERFLQEVSKA